MQIKQFVPEQHKVKALVYGKPGTGKTTFASTAPKALFLSAEGGLLSIAAKNPDYVEIKSLANLKEALLYLKTQKHDYQTVVIDSITEINEIIKTEIANRNGHAVQKHEWSEVQDKIKQIARGFRDLPLHVLFLAGEVTERDDEKIATINPSLNGKSSSEISGYMDIVGYLSIDRATGYRKIYVKSSASLATKDRGNVLPDDPTLDFADWVTAVAKIKIGVEKVKEEFQSTEEMEENEDTLSDVKTPKSPVFMRATIGQIRDIKEKLEKLRGKDTDETVVRKLKATIKAVLNVEI